MKTPIANQFNIADLAFVLIAAVFSFSCIATTFHTAKTANPDQVQVSAGYMQNRSVEDFSEEPVQLIGISSRYGVTKGFDLGAEYTWDVTKNNNNDFASIWIDGKVQITNRHNAILKPIISSGMMKGYIYDSEIQTHVTTLPLLLSLPVNERITPTLTYRFELLSDGFFPTSLTNPRHSVLLGVEYAIAPENRHHWQPTINFTFGTINSLDGGDGSRLLIFNLGMKMNSPYGRR